MKCRKGRGFAAAPVLLLAVVIAVSWGRADGHAEEEKPVVLTMKRFVEEAAKNDPAFQEILIDECALAYRKKLNLPSGDLVVAATAQYDMNLSPGGNSGPETTVSLSKLFPRTGTALSAGYTRYPSRYSEGSISSFTALVSQPIARNAFGRANRLLEEIEDIAADIARHQIVEAYEDYLATLLVLYHGWYTAYENLATARSSYRDSMRLLANMRARQRNRIALQVDVDRVELQTIERKETLAALECDYEKKRVDIYRATGYRGDRAMVPSLDGSYGMRNIDFKAEYRRFKEEGRTVRMLNLLEGQRRKEAGHYADALLPSANLIIGYSRSQLESRYNPKKTSEILYGGVSLEFPVGLQHDRARYEIARVSARKEKIAGLGTRARLEADIKNLYREIVARKELVRLARNRVAVAARIVAAEERNYLLARTSLVDYLKTIDDLESARFEMTTSIVTLNTLMVEWLRITDSLVTRREIRERHKRDDR